MRVLKALVTWGFWTHDGGKSAGGKKLLCKKSILVFGILFAQQTEHVENYRSRCYQ